MKQQMNNSEGLNFKPFLAINEQEIITPSVAHPIEYDEDRMILVIDGNPAVLSSKYSEMVATKVTMVSQETTDDE
jgi:hypothetical protein